MIQTLFHKSLAQKYCNYFRYLIFFLRQDGKTVSTNYKIINLYLCNVFYVSSNENHPSSIELDVQIINREEKSFVWKLQLSIILCYFSYNFNKTVFLFSSCCVWQYQKPKLYSIATTVRKNVFGMAIYCIRIFAI